MVYAKEGFVLTKEIERLLLCEFCSVRYESIIDYETLLDDELKCEGCFGIVGKSIKLSEKIITRLKKYEFDSFVIGCAVDKSLIKKDDELFNRYEKYIPLKNKQSANDNLLENPMKVDEGIFTCSKCKSQKTLSYQKQTRGADEPMTNFITCYNCGKKWVEN